MAERSGGAHVIRGSRPYDHAAHHQVTNATDYYAMHGDPSAAMVRAATQPKVDEDGDKD